MSDIEGKVAREAMSECGQRASFQHFTDFGNGSSGAFRLRSFSASEESRDIMGTKAPRAWLSLTPSASLLAPVSYWLA